MTASGANLPNDATWFGGSCYRTPEFSARGPDVVTSGVFRVLNADRARCAQESDPEIRRRLVACHLEFSGHLLERHKDRFSDNADGDHGCALTLGSRLRLDVGIKAAP